MQEIEEKQSLKLNQCLKLNGYLEKQNSSGIQKYKKRFFYFFFHDNQISLLYKDQEKDQKPIGQIQLSQVTDVKYDSEKKKKFKIIHENREFKFRCQTRIDAIQWWENIKFLLNYQHFILTKKIEKQRLSQEDSIGESPIKIDVNKQSSFQKLDRQNSYQSGNSSKKSDAKKVSQQTLSAIKLFSEDNLDQKKVFSKQNTQITNHFNLEVQEKRNSENLSNFNKESQLQHKILVQQQSSNTNNSYDMKRGITDIPQSQDSIEKNQSSKSSPFSQIIDIDQISLTEKISSSNNNLGGIQVQKSNFCKNDNKNNSEENNDQQYFNSFQSTENNSNQKELSLMKNQQIQKQQIKIEEQAENIKNLEQIIGKLEKENIRIKDLYRNKSEQQNSQQTLEENQELTEQNKKLKDLVLSQKQQIYDLEVHNKQLIRQKEEFQNEIKGLKQDLYKLEEAKDYKIKIINENLESEEKENDELKKKILQLKEDLEYANSEAIKNKMEFAEINQAKDEYQIQVKYLKKQIQEIQLQNQVKKNKK